jgi:hypothetical protein
MVLDIQTVRTSYLKKYSSSKCKQTVGLHYGLDFHFKLYKARSLMGAQVSSLALVVEYCSYV